MSITTSMRRFAVLAGGSAGALALVATSAVGAGGDPVLGTGKGDDIKGTKGADVVFAFGGKDWVTGRGGPDELHGNRGNDYLAGGKGRDVLIGGPGADGFAAGGRADRIFGGKGEDWVYLGKDRGIDRVDCGSERDKVYGVTKRDEIADNCEFVTSDLPSCRVAPTRFAAEARC